MDEEYATTDLVTAGYLSVEGHHAEIRPLNEESVEFVFAETESLQDDLSALREGNARVNPFAFHTELAELRSRIRRALEAG